LLERRYERGQRERTAAAANAGHRPLTELRSSSLTLTAEGGFAHNTLAHLFTVPNVSGTLGPQLAETIFDGGARRLRCAERARPREDVAKYRNTVLTAFQSVETAVVDEPPCGASPRVREGVRQQRRLFATNRRQFKLRAQSASRAWLTQRLTLLEAEQNLRDTQGAARRK